MGELKGCKVPAFFGGSAEIQGRVFEAGSFGGLGQNRAGLADCPFLIRRAGWRTSKPRHVGQLGLLRQPGAIGWRVVRGKAAMAARAGRETGFSGGEHRAGWIASPALPFCWRSCRGGPGAALAPGSRGRPFVAGWLKRDRLHFAGFFRDFGPHPFQKSGGSRR